MIRAAVPKAKTFGITAWAARLRWRWRNCCCRLGARLGDVRPILVAVFLVFGALASNAYALDPNALPSGGKVVAGGGSISQSGKALTVTQTTSKLIAD